MASIIPLRPEGWAQTSLTQAEQTALTWYHLSKCTRKEAFIAFARPDLMEAKNKAMVDDYLRQFFSRRDVREYLDAYAETMENFLHPKVQKKEPVGTMEERKARAKAKATEFAMGLAENIDQADDPEYVLKLMDKVGLLEGEEEVVEAPRRYLPVQCVRECAYRQFCEENTEDMCQYCRYHAFGEENGIHYGKEHLLDIPEQSGTEVADTKSNK